MEVNGYRQLFKTFLGELFLLIISEPTQIRNLLGQALAFKTLKKTLYPRIWREPGFQREELTDIKLVKKQTIRQQW